MLMELSNILGEMPMIMKIIVAAISSGAIILWQRKLYYKHKDDEDEI